MSDKPLNTAAAAGFQNATAYEQMMGRWSRRLAPLLIRYGGLSDGDKVLDVGSGTGNLTFTALELANLASVAGIDRALGFVEFATSRNTDPRVEFQQGDARALPFEDNYFDRAFSMLVMQFIPDAPLAVAEMRRVVRSGGTITAAVWDDFSGLPSSRMIWDIAATLDLVLRRPFLRPMSKPNEMATVWTDLGLVDVEQKSLLIRMEFGSFDDYWLPFTKGEGPAELVVGLSASARSTLTEHVRQAYLSGQQDGPRSFAATAWACKGRVPDDEQGDVSRVPTVRVPECLKRNCVGSVCDCTPDGMLKAIVYINLVCLNEADARNELLGRLA